ncbi:hypothetical protein FB45DRAFT_1150778 [Roridomyces roridus]|uniref:HMG box domain-containing protein n=1 Tax=Roridomyces roridus TaxID=1738132 RepID=A0AAD7BTM0_9AGAR|nr:hypothetical protein FB45DRAFT_1150778 [Roridomyces roridus]
MTDGKTASSCTPSPRTAPRRHPSHPRHRRRSSQPSSPPAAPSHARRRPADHIPRPPNPFICFRMDYCVWNKQLVSGSVRDHRVVSKLAGHAWKALDDASRQKYVDIAGVKKKEHAILYPNYEYSPTPRTTGGKGKKRKAPVDDDDYDYEEAPSKRRKHRSDVQPLTIAACLDSASSDHSVSPSPTWHPTLLPSSIPSTPHVLTRELSPPLSFVTSTPSLFSFEDEDDEEDFVATADIPPLDLYADFVRLSHLFALPSNSYQSQKKELTPDRAVVPSLSLEAYGTQFFKTGSPQQARECMWYNAAGEILIDTTAAAPAASTSSLKDEPELQPITGDVQFTNPFQLSMDEFFNVDAL